jgi:hypothetical protein
MARSQAEEDRDQIEGEPGRADNVKGDQKSDDADIDKHDMGFGENTMVAMRNLGINRQMYERDQSVDERFLIMPDPDRAGKPSTPSGVGKEGREPKDQSITY